ncbi:MAG TPA: hypothetical protein VFT69_17125 [Pseudolabrys sp.]|nr:hypothetical protein [Pseudolabrys sp.]
MKRFRQGVVTLTRSVPGEPDPSTPWEPGPAVDTVYTLDATVAAIEDKFVNGTTILATDSMITAGPKMTKTMVDGEAVAPEVVDTDVQPGDVVAVDGAVVTTIKEMRLPKAGVLIAWKFIVRG